jgi:hypothetical protein
MSGRALFTITAALVIAALMASAVWLAAGAYPHAYMRKPSVPVANGTFTTVYEAKVLCKGGKKFTAELTLKYHNGKLIEATLNGREIPLAAFKYPHSFTYIGELLLDLDKVEKVGNKTVRPLGGIVHKRHDTKPVNFADSSFVARSPLVVETSFNYSRLAIKGHGELINATINGAMLIFDAEARVPYFFMLDILHASMREFCTGAFAHIVAFLKEVK